MAMVFQASGWCNNTASFAVGGVLFGMISVGLHATDSARSPPLGDVPRLRRARGSRSRAGRSIFFGRGFSVVGTWIYEIAIFTIKWRFPLNY